MKKILSLLVIPVLMVTMVTPVLAQESLPYTTDLIADGRDTAQNVGYLNVAIDGTVTFQIDVDNTDWRLDEIHLYVGDEAPVKSAPGRFPYIEEGLGGADSYDIVVDLAAADDNGDGIVYIAAHAELVMLVGTAPDTEDQIYDYETAWAQGNEPIGHSNNWATCFSVSVTGVAPPAEEEEEVIEDPSPQDPGVPPAEEEEEEIEDPSPQDPGVPPAEDEVETGTVAPNTPPDPAVSPPVEEAETGMVSP